MEPLTPLYTAHLFAPLHHRLVELLEGLDPADWQRPTMAPAWRVCDVAAHLLEVDLRRLSVGRDGHRIEPGRPIGGYRDLVGFLNQLNAEWVAAARRFSPRVLVELLRYSGSEMARMVAELPQHDPAPFAVDWAGERGSENWFDIGRDYTERWHHQMQIREAVGAADLLDERWLLPLLDLSVRCLPRSYAGVDAAPGTAVVLHVLGNAAAVWTLRLEQGAWRLWRGATAAPTTTVRLDPDTAWRMFFNALSPADARRRAMVDGDAELAEPLFGARAVMV
jgi:uncharacterized protein (TIGR03083 family)